MHQLLLLLMLVACGHHSPPASYALDDPSWRPPGPPDCFNMSAPNEPPALVAAWHDEGRTRTWATGEIAALERVYRDGGGETLLVSLADGARVTLLERPRGQVGPEAQWLSTALDVALVESGAPPEPEETVPKESTARDTDSPPGPPITMGSLDKAAIGQVIQSDMMSVRYCYQRELQTKRLLGGYLKVKFVIAKDGTVSSADVVATTLNEPAVEDCVVERFLGYEFPEPVGGGIVIVKYPFIFMQH